MSTESEWLRMVCALGKEGWRRFECFQMQTTPYKCHTIKAIILNTNLVSEPSELFFSNSLFESDLLAVVSERHSVISVKQRTVFLMTHLIRKFHRQSETILDSCSSTEWSVKACLLVPCHFKFHGCEADSYCISNSWLLLLKSLHVKCST